MSLETFFTLVDVPLFILLVAGIIAQLILHYTDPRDLPDDLDD